MVKNPQADAWIGAMHGEMTRRVKNPFRTDFMRRNYDAAVTHYDERGRTFFYPNGKRCYGSAWAQRFWHGFDGVDACRWDRASKQSPAYAMWCAGRDIRSVLVREGAHDSIGLGRGIEDDDAERTAT